MRLPRASLEVLLVVLLALACEPTGGSKSSDSGVTGPDGAQLADAAVVADDAASQADAAVDPDAWEAPDAAVPDMAPTEGCADEEASVVELTTDDGVRLVADFHPGPATGRAVALFHMIPPSNDRTNYPTGFIHALVERGFTVINVDRRGAGDSDGDAREAYTGPNGRLDVKAAWDHLLAPGCGVRAEQVGLVGASNGTTSVLDFTADPFLPRPAAIVFLTGGGYTENQTAIAANGDALSTLPIDFVFSTDERAWSAGFAGDAPEVWNFDEYAPGGHGTRMFGVQPDSVTAVADWLDEVVP